MTRNESGEETTLDGSNIPRFVFLVGFLLEGFLKPLWELIRLLLIVIIIFQHPTVNVNYNGVECTHQ